MSDDIAPEAPPATAPDPAPWGIRGAVVVTVLAYAFQVVILAGMGAIAGIVIVTMDPNIADHPEDLRDLSLLVSLVPGALASALLTLLLVWASVTVVCRRPLLESLGLRRPSAPGAAAAALMGAAIALVYVGLALAFPPDSDFDLGGPLTRLAESGPVGFVLLLLLAIVMAPVVEEVLFRGYAYLGARQRIGAVPAGVCVTIAFVALHMVQTGTYWPALAGIGTMAGSLVVVMERSGNLSYCIAAHLGYNAALALLSLAAIGPAG